MNSIYLVLFGLTSFYLGYRFYSKYIAKNIFDLDENIITPAHEFNDGVDFVPTTKHILFGHHFTSIAGAAPIIGPCIASYWGWLPAIIWVVIGTIFIGAVHDFGALVISLKEKGNSIADITGKFINKEIRIIFLIFVMLLTWLVLAVFAMAISGLFVSIPTSVIPINIEIIIALFIGIIIYKKKLNATIPSIIALILLYFFIWVGTQFPIDFQTLLNIDKSQAINIWILLLFGYSAIASLLPVWSLLQPRDYINSHQLFVGLALLFAGIFYAAPIVDAPMIRTQIEDGSPPIFPMLFVTIACGAISGFHGLVSSGTTSKQVDKLKHARMIGYGGMLGEGTLALASTLCAVSGIALVNNCTIPSVGIVENLNWAVYYDSWAHATTNKAVAFVLGGGALLEQIGISAEIAKTIMAVLVISFAATTLDTATRIQRFIINELSSSLKIKLFQNRYISTILAIIPAIILAMWKIQIPGSESFKQAGWILWPIFGATNQMLAGLILMILTLYFWKKGKKVILLFIPMIFIMSIAFISLYTKTIQFKTSNNNLLFGLGIILILLFIKMIYEGIKYYFKNKLTISVNK
ncbi:MAG: carbon starvation protein A [Candidatus Marinimicrobia bacterium]|nr:carbon starvation protein A [Candidatus Neomarinimicrobiota bacterium]